MRALEAEGFVVLPSVVGEAALAALDRIAERAECGDAAAMGGKVTAHGATVPLDYRDPDAVTAVTDDGVLTALRDAGASDVRWLSGYTVSKPPGASRLWWHQDWWAWGDAMTTEPAPAQAFVMVALDDTSPANGCLRVLPGSHRGRHPLHALLPEAHSEQAERVPADHPAFADQPGEVAVPLRRGDVAVTDVRLLHATHANTTGATRRVAVLSYLPHFAALPARFRAHYRAHPCQPPADGEPPAARLAPLLPTAPDGPAEPVEFDRTPRPPTVVDGHRPGLSTGGGAAVPDA